VIGADEGSDRPPVPQVPTLDEATAAARLAEASEALIDGVGAALPTWAARAADTLLTSWGGLDARRRQEVVAAAGEAGEQAARRVAAELGDLLGIDPAEQRATPLEIIRGAVAEPTAVLAAAGLPDVVRDPFEERAWPDDHFGLVPRTLRDLDPDLAAIHFAWGIAKASLLRARIASGPHTERPR
jgi:non-ribosomal peptide synthetase component F